MDQDYGSGLCIGIIDRDYGSRLWIGIMGRDYVMVLWVSITQLKSLCEKSKQHSFDL